MHPIRFACVKREGEQHAINPPVLKRIHCILTGFLAQHQLQVRALVLQARQQARDHERCDGRDHAHAQLPRKRLSGGLHKVREFLCLAQELVRFRHHLLTQRGKPDHSARAFDQSHAQERFQLPDPRRQRRLRDKTRIRRTPEMAMLMQRDEILQLLDGGEVGGHRCSALAHPAGCATLTTPHPVQIWAFPRFEMLRQTVKNTIGHRSLVC